MKGMEGEEDFIEKNTFFIKLINNGRSKSITPRCRLQDASGGGY